MSDPKTTPVIVGYVRSPFTPAYKGELKEVRADDLMAQTIKGLLEKTGVDPKLIEELKLGNAFPEGEQGLNLARNVTFLSGLPNSVSAVTTNKFCGSSMQTLMDAANAISAGQGDVFIAAGVESMSRIPMGGFNPMPSPALMDKYPAAYIGMGETADNLAKKYNISRQAQDEFAVLSHQKAAQAREDGKFKDEITAIGDIDQDGCIRPDSTVETLSGMKPAFDKDGSVTAATSSPLTDGAVATLICSEEYAKANGLEILARIKSIAVAGCASEIMGIGPVPATKKALERAGLTLNDIDVIELNEAFAAQSLSVIEELGADMNKINLDGGAIALGHPLGASGGRITGKLASIMKREGKSLGLATMCIGGGQGIATILERV